MKIITTTIAAATFAIAAPAMAASPADARSMEVTFADLNLQSEEGVDRFDRRLKIAAKEVCGATSPINANPSEMTQMRICQRETLARVKAARDLAVANADSPRFASAKRTIRLTDR